MLDDTEIARTAVTAGGLGLLGRLVYWAVHDQRHPIGWSLLWELPLALGMGWIGLGVSEYLGLATNATYAMTISVSYTGPRLLDLLLLHIARRNRIDC